jgi:hypothetical protein
MPKPDGGRQSGRSRSELERLLDRTVLGPTHPDLGTCWSCTGTTTPYGRIAKAQDSYAHRLGWKLLRGPIPEDKELHHRCGIYACWNPDHLELVTHAEINGTCARRTASMGIRCLARTCGSGQTEDEPAGRVTQRTSGRSGNASVLGRLEPRAIRPPIEIPHRIRYVNFPTSAPPRGGQRRSRLPSARDPWMNAS